MYLRFVVGAESENGFRLNGILSGARMLRDEGRFYTYESDLLDDVFGWLNAYLPCPPFRRKLQSGEWTCDAVSWFRSEAKEPIRRIWDIVAILREHRVPQRRLVTSYPGEIVYSDEFQIVAETPRWA